MPAVARATEVALVPEFFMASFGTKTCHLWLWLMAPWDIGSWQRAVSLVLVYFGLPGGSIIVVREFQARGGKINTKNKDKGEVLWPIIARISPAPP